MSPRSTSASMRDQWRCTADVGRGGGQGSCTFLGGGCRESTRSGASSTWSGLRITRISNGPSRSHERAASVSPSRTRASNSGWRCTSRIRTPARHRRRHPPVPNPRWHLRQGSRRHHLHAPSSERSTPSPRTRRAPPTDGTEFPATTRHRGMYRFLDAIEGGEPPSG